MPRVSEDFPNVQSVSNGWQVSGTLDQEKEKSKVGCGRKMLKTTASNLSELKTEFGREGSS